MPEEKKKRIEKLQKKYISYLDSAMNDTHYHIPLFHRMIDKYHNANTLEALFFFLKTGDPEIDRRMLRAVMIRDDEMVFHAVTGLLWSTVVLLLPGWAKFRLATRLTTSALPFIGAMYRGFRRGYDQINYVGETFLEMHMRKMSMLEYFRDHKDYLPEFREHLVNTGKLIPLLEAYALLED